jgi:ferric-dicitrate binding protein FerR (iron transport regulator)
MSNPIPWKRESEPLHREVRVARELLDEAFPEPEWSQKEQDEVWRKLAHRRPSKDGKILLPAFALAGWGLAAATAVALVVREPSRVSKPGVTTGAVVAAASATDVSVPDGTADWEPVSLGSEGNLRVKPGSRLEITAGSAVATASADATPKDPNTTAATSGARRILLRDGELCAQITHRDVPKQGPLVVEAPQMKVVVIGTKFCFETNPRTARVRVTEGRVRVETPQGTSAFVAAGEEIRSDDERLRGVPHGALIPATLDVPAAPAPEVEGCAGLGGVDRASCFRHVADGKGLAAQNALYGLGLLARQQHDGPAALRYWHDYQKRFPHGVLAPEASLGILGELMAERSYSEAVDEADSYLKAFPDGLVAEVTLAKAEILQTGLNSPDSAIPIYLGLLTGDLSPSVRQEVLYSMGLSEQAEGYSSQARELWERYLATYPRGPHAAQVSQLLRGL